MAYLLADVELSRPLPSLSLRGEEDGVGVLVRLHDRPIDFVLQALPAGSTLAPEALEALIAGAARVKLVALSLADELAPRLDPRPVEVTILHAPPSTAALERAGTRWVAFLAPGATADRGWRAGLEEALAEQPDAAAVTGLVLPSALETDAQVELARAGGLGLGFGKLRLTGARRAGSPFHPVDGRLLGASGNVVVRRDLALAVGGFDSSLAGTGAHEPELLFRLVHSGHVLAYEPRMLAFHVLHAGSRAAGARFVAQVGQAGAVDPSQRARARRAVAWWAAKAGKRLVRGPVRLDPRTRGAAVAELAGGLGAAIRARRS